MNMAGDIQGDVLAIEKHSGGKWNFVILLALIGPVLAVTLAPGGPPWPIVVVALLGLPIFALVWSGFEYRFTTGGVEVRMAGFRLREIPRQDILGYAIEHWPFIRGRGIRGWGRTRAYVWSDKVVHIRLTNGDVYLGHDHPDRLVRDLDRVTGVLARG